MEKFRILGLSEASIKALEHKGFEEPTEIQEKTIPLLLQSNKNIIAQAQTGTGKTAVFGLTFIEKLLRDAKHTQALVLTPTRELAIQVAEEINSLKGDNQLKIVPIYGGQSITLQLKQLKYGVDIIIGTPGRILDHIRQKSLTLTHIKYAVLDEADEMLNMGFIDDVEEILSHTNKTKQLLLFSATMPERIMSLARKHMSDYTLIQAKKTQLTTNLVDQIYFEVRESDKFEALCRIIDIEKNFYGIIFCRTKNEVDAITTKLADRGYNAECLHGDIAQRQREQILTSFKNKKIMTLVATDVAARGIDVNNLSHVINYSLPQDPESYVHRIGRTGRAGNEGTAITFVTPDEYRRLSFIMKMTKTDIRKEQIPDAEEIIAIKKERLNSELKKIIETENLQYYKDMVDSIVGDIDKTIALAAILKYSFSEEFDISNYNTIKPLNISKKSYSSNNNEQTRLFITIGRLDKMTPRELVKFIEDETGVSKNFINNVDIFDSFSFITVPFEEAELILEKFKERKKGSRVV
ncbi:MAG: RNA helicase, partial [Spirochaetes bacterium GWC1_27_15]